MKNCLKLLWISIVLTATAFQTKAQCDQQFYSDLGGPCATAICNYDPYCCETEWDFVCAGEAASEPQCMYCWVDCHDNDLDGFTNCDGDCDDFNANVFPGNSEVCSNNVDEDCDGFVDNTNGACDNLFYADLASPCAVNVCAFDDFCCSTVWDFVCASEAIEEPACADCLCGCYDNDFDGYTNCDGDCNDFDDQINPSASEQCNGIDDNCDLMIDEGLVFEDYYFDLDGDGYGSSLIGSYCSAPPLGSLINGDCDDSNSAINPDATDLCANSIDEDCNGELDDADGHCDVTNYSDLSGPCAIEVCSFDPFCCTNLWDAICVAEAISAPICNYCLCGCYDIDLDGFGSCEGDCNDSNAEIFPGSTEICNELDDDCDGTIDNDVILDTFYRDNDGDGYGSVVNSVNACFAPVGYVHNATDCDDNNDTVNPGAAEVCNDADENCDGAIDNGLPILEFYFDFDEDGYGNPLFSVSDCAAPLGYVLNDGDCDDTNPNVHPGATEVCNDEDDDCDGTADDNVVFNFYFADSDEDGFGDANLAVFDCTTPFGYVLDNTDCDDADNNVHPGAAESCDETDEDCDGFIDEGVTNSTYYLDNDNDGYGDSNNTIVDCVAPSGYVDNDTDCNDADNTIHPNAAEVCNNTDEDCDGFIDEGQLTFTYYADEDEDGFGDPNNSLDRCSMPIGYVSDDADCDDTDASIYPGASETCDDTDEDCDGIIDNGLATSTYYLDSDQDGFGDFTHPTSDCSEPNGYVSNSTDCDDVNAAIHPGAAETCDDVDEDCDGFIDEGIINFTYYADTDDDGHGDENNFVIACTQPVGYVGTNSDCDDTNANIHPDAPEICNDEDEDCDGLVDEGLAQTTYYADADGDGFGDPSSSLANCNLPTGYVSNDTDCDDTNEEIHPLAAESCDNIDNNCNGFIDEGIVPITYFEDTDGDGFGDASSTIQDCIAPSGYVSNSTDCNDSDSSIYPGGIEFCNTLDDDCDGEVDDNVFDLNYYTDLDGDGFGTDLIGAFCLPQNNASTSDGDCNDADDTINPGANEICNDTDDDCDGDTDENVTLVLYYNDADNDGFGEELLGGFCTQPSGSVENNLDCDDTRGDINPNANEICNTLDDDCDGAVDNNLVFSDYYEDLDGDGFGDFYFGFLCTAPLNSVPDGGDCDDADENINPGMSDICNSIDDDCSGQIDDGLFYLTYYSDADGDGFGSTLLGDYCIQPLSSSTIDGDCNDGDASIYPGAQEICNNNDDDCDTNIDNDIAFVDYFEDVDGDGFGGAFIGNFCQQPPLAVANGDDCDDADASINPDGEETCDTIDEDCDGVIDNNLLTHIYYADLDNDGFGAELIGVFCSPPANSAVTPGDCDDSTSAINPLENESCNNLDDDCDGTIDNDVVYADYYLDTDNDGFGSDFIGNFCVAPSNSATNNGDCDDDNVAINPSADETCNDADDDCDGGVDEGLETFTYYSDVDGDGYGSTLLGNFCSPPDQSSIADGDCDDTNDALHPGLPEYCNEVDDNCDGNIDENVVFSDYFSDEDGDGYGSIFLGNFCVPPSDAATNSSDCDDSNAAIHPGAFEFCNLIDDDCDGLINEGLSTTTYYQDTDGDAVGGILLGAFCYTPENASTLNGDCDDSDATVYPGAIESCNNADDNCNGAIDEGAYTSYFADDDNDGFGDHTQLVEACTQPAGYVANEEDCDDANAAIYPGAIEYCNSLDDDCDGLIDENCIIGVEEMDIKLFVEIFPNPVHDQLSLKIAGAKGTLQYVITDAVGKIVLTSSILSGNGMHVLDCSGLAHGSYTLTIQQDQIQLHQKFVKL